ncbi:MAG: acyl-CoA synthetase, AMP-forming [Fibrobacteres bacterium]|nr:acyl-CoA synthetase, AMP-forming [Fibrobacterota bacterium]
MLLDHFLAHSAARHPGKTALICGDRRATYAEVDEGANALARAYLALGLKRQERVCIYFDNSVETVQGLFAALKAAGVFLVVNPGVKGDKLAYILGDCDALILVTGRRNLKPVEAEVAAVPGLRHVILVDYDAEAGEDPGSAFPVLRAAGKDVHGLASLTAAQPRTPPANPNIDLDLASLIYTSGSTGTPKGVTLTHLNMVAAATSITGYLANQEEDIILAVLPLAFDYGLYQVLMAFKFGGTVVLERMFLYPGRFLELIAREKVTGLPIVPTILAILLNLKDLEEHDFSSVRYLSNTAQALPVHHIARLRRVMPKARIYSMYGLTECKRVAYLPPELIDKKPSSVGIAIPNTEVWIEDEEGNRITAPWAPGELVVRGSHVMVGYWNKPEETAKCLKAGPNPHERILRTGDLFKQDEDGHLYFISRKDDLIKTAGERVGPREIENVLYELPQVREAAVIGVPDEILGQAIKAFLALADGAILTDLDVIKHCQNRLEKFMVPRHVEFRPELPKTNTGKISKKGLA